MIITEIIFPTSQGCAKGKVLPSAADPNSAEFRPMPFRLQEEEIHAKWHHKDHCELVLRQKADRTPSGVSEASGITHPKQTIRRPH
ncbi:hypothetical protein BaRGS_00000852 [Batillaria attramentaria]|uniref:Uncharacterized protein n=1 Tax=Batillaria attramentaria TaxID=370345 RepID=A0ABD0M834_9CAEN